MEYIWYQRPRAFSIRGSRGEMMKLGIALGELLEITEGVESERGKNAYDLVNTMRWELVEAVSQARLGKPVPYKIPKPNCAKCRWADRTGDNDPQCSAQAFRLTEGVYGTDECRALYEEHEDEVRPKNIPLYVWKCDVCGTFFEHILPEPECPKCGGETHRATQEDV